MFEPYIKTLNEIDSNLVFFIGTEQARDWYDPLPVPLKVELRWILDHVDLSSGRKVIDAGCHHGLYSVVMGSRGAEIHAVDLHRPNLDLCIVNCSLNGVHLNYGHAAITDQIGWVHCKDRPLGAVDAEGETIVRSVRLEDICRDANVVKMDIEGAEFLVMPDALDTMEKVDTWIMEVHPWWFPITDYKDIFSPFVEHGFELQWINRAKDCDAVVEPLQGEIIWKSQSTILATR